MTRSEARMIAEELLNLLRKDANFQESVAQICAPHFEEYMGVKEAAKMLGWAVRTVYNKKDELPHTKNGKTLLFPKSGLLKYMQKD